MRPEIIGELKYYGGARYIIEGGRENTGVPDILLRGPRYYWGPETILGNGDHWETRKNTQDQRDYCGTQKFMMGPETLLGSRYIINLGGVERILEKK